MANANIPVLNRAVSAESTSTPDFQSTFNDLAASQNSLSGIGARVAQTASNKIASTLGYESGKTPNGDLSIPPLTDFDKTFQDSYHTQANATLALQGEKLLNDAQIEMSKPNRLNPQLIKNTTAQLQVGLDKIAEQAPTAVKGSLKASFGSQVLDQNRKYNEKMFAEQREDQKNTIINSIDLNVKNALELAKNGDTAGAENLIASTKATAASAGESKLITPEQARVAQETVIQAGMDGKFINEAMQAYKDNKYPEFEKHYAENKPAGMTNEQWLNSGQAFKQQVSFLESLKAQDENLKAQGMINNIATDPTSITSSQWTDFESSVSPIKAAEVQFKYIQALKAAKSSGISIDGLIKSFSSPEAWANSSEKTQDAAYNRNVDYMMQQSQKNGTNLTREEAQVQVAASAGGKVSVFTKQLKNQLSSANADQIESAARQIHSLYEMGAGRALKGLNEQDQAAYTKYEALRNSMDGPTAAREMSDTVYNQDTDVQRQNKEKWSNFLTSKTAGGLPGTTFALNAVNMKPSDFLNLKTAQAYGTDILEKYSTYFQLMNGDNNAALKITQREVDENYGDTGVNGGSHKALHPIEKVLGFESKDAVPYIQDDVVNQLNSSFAPVKQAYAENKVNEYWETVPKTVMTHSALHNPIRNILNPKGPEHIEPNDIVNDQVKPYDKNKENGFQDPQFSFGHLAKNTEYGPVQVRRHTRTTNGERVDTYNVAIQGNSFDSWDIGVDNGSGMMNIFQIAPYLGIQTYKPNAFAIKLAYFKDHQFKG